MNGRQKCKSFAGAVLTGIVFLHGAAVAAVGGPAIRVTGSSTLFPFAAAVAEHFGAQGGWKTPIVESVGTGGGFALFCAGGALGTPDITDASREISDEERQACVRNRVGELVAVRVGYDGMVIASSRNASPIELTRDELYRAVAKEVVVGGRLVPNPYRRWNEVDPALPPRPIRVFGPAPNHGTRDAFVALVMVPRCEHVAEIRALPDVARRQACQAVREDGRWIDVAGDYQLVLGRIANDPEAVAVLPFSYLDRNRDRIQAAAIDGVTPRLESITGWSYPLSRPLFLYIKKSHVGLVPGLAEFVQEFLSEAAAGADGYLAERGLAPQPRGYLAEERAKALRALTLPR